MPRWPPTILDIIMQLSRASIAAPTFQQELDQPSKVKSMLISAAVNFQSKLDGIPSLKWQWAIVDVVFLLAVFAR